jgi:hypothetical protein
MLLLAGMLGVAMLGACIMETASESDLGTVEAELSPAPQQPLQPRYLADCDDVELHELAVCRPIDAGHAYARPPHLVWRDRSGIALWARDKGIN